MRLLLSLAVATLLAGCAVGPSCYIGVSLIPVGPFVHCGVDVSPEKVDE